jgi:hypothetical protein
MTVLVETSKINTYNVVAQADARASKINTYNVVAQVDARASKINTYLVLAPTIAPPASSQHFLGSGMF